VYDVIIIGGGAAGLTAALYAARRSLKTLVLSQDIGGQAAMTADIENYPGFEMVDGLELMTRFQRQAEKFGAEVKIEEAQKIERIGDEFRVVSSLGRYEGHAIILSFGLTHKHMGVPGEVEHIGKGVSYCATCDAPLFRGKPVVVVGGGNLAMDADLLLDQLCPEVNLLTKNEELRGERVLVDRVAESSSIKVQYGVSVTAVLGGNRVSGVVVTNPGGIEQQLAVAGVFVEIGFTINASLIKDLVELDQRKQVIISDDNGTSIPGMFAAGDVTTIDQKQIVISAGEGAKAALAANQYLQARGLVKKSVKIDWGVKAPTHHATVKP
jgi:thioredoxin-disulfide reductase